MISLHSGYVKCVLLPWLHQYGRAIRVACQLAIHHNIGIGCIVPVAK